ncbi:hypothetical protein EMIHUDRAFT_195098 [Emiliania huxleyi CCMP1516]|uniref:Right handed beta helix domain-containing protein n=2 Tax=Emiliania huxleyi TaxID=2903 RepID=A0A0D3JGW7_EMIH1|nr:hypothetical protein EMIHUDRAFT_195098 [Emiliania huxleyi CCMP1516]EOD22752.1 hypothetical protein EMIHUDRAFT_195098 [Emiliania huxleyi CCMP1516]|eukprot:XP_005775181.1 hypothetical protein EMIHUDRAFT_195098 [Emiliania huxleyi CCMP1516]
MNIYAVAVLSALHVGVPAANGARRRLADSGGLVEVDLSNIQGSSERLRRQLTHYEEMSREPAHDSEEVHSVQDSEEIHDSVHDSEEVHDSEGNDSEEVHASVQDSEEVHISSHDSVHDSEEPIGHADSEEPRTWLTAPSPPLACASVNPATGDTCYPPGPPLPPLLPLRDGEVLATTAQEIQDEVDAAFLEGRNASVYLQSGALIRFTREVVCSSSIHLSVRSSGSGARLQAEGRTRMFRIGNGWSSEAATGSLSLEAVHFLVGTAADNGEKGGALYAYTGSIVMKDVSFTDCWAADQGGAIFAHTIGSIVLTDVRFTNCLAGFGGDGGAVYTDSAGGISLIGVAFTDCHARRIGSGGALYAINFGDLTMTDVAFTDCHAQYGGGALAAYDFGDLTMTDVAFLGCSAVVAGGAVVAGIFTGAGAADITTTGVTGVQPFGDISLSGVSFTNCSSANAYGAIAIFDVSGNVSSKKKNGAKKLLPRGLKP